MATETSGHNTSDASPFITAAQCVGMFCMMTSVHMTAEQRLRLQMLLEVAFEAGVNASARTVLVDAEKEQIKFLRYEDMAILVLEYKTPETDTGTQQYFFTCFRKAEQYRIKYMALDPFPDGETEQREWYGRYLQWIRKQTGLKEVFPQSI